MTSRDSLSPWCIIQHLPKMQRPIIARFRKRNDAEAHLRLLNYLNPAVTYELMFDPPPEQQSEYQSDTPPCEAHAMVKRGLNS